MVNDPMALDLNSIPGRIDGKPHTQASARTQLYNRAHPKYPPLGEANGIVGGTWMIGSCYKNDNRLHGAYPRGFLNRVHSMFPDATSILHVFSGGLTLENAMDAAGMDYNVKQVWINSEAVKHPAPSIELVDIHGPEQGRYPTWQGDLFDMPEEWHGRFDLILADPPYSKDDAEKYDVPMVNRGKVIRSLHPFCATGGNLVWLDQQWPMHSKQQWKTWATIGLVRSTQHRMRLVSFFERQP